MGIRLEITTDVALSVSAGITQRQQIDDALTALGFMREAMTVPALGSPGLPPLAGPFSGEGQSNAVGNVDAVQPSAPAASAAPTTSAPVAPSEVTPRKRRTKAEIEAEKTAEAPQITISPENRVDPETAAQDTADEAAESEATQAPELTHDNVRNALGAYVKKYGMEAAQEDGPKLLKVIFGDAAGKVSDIPNDQVSLGKAVEGANEMLTKNPYGRKEV